MFAGSIFCYQPLKYCSNMQTWRLSLFGRTSVVAHWWCSRLSMPQMIKRKRVMQVETWMHWQGRGFRWKWQWCWGCKWYGQQCWRMPNWKLDQEVLIIQSKRGKSNVKQWTFDMQSRSIFSVCVVEFVKWKFLTGALMRSCCYSNMVKIKCNLSTYLLLLNCILIITQFWTGK